MTATEKKITLKTLEGEVFEVDEAVALMSQTIKHMIEDGCADNAIPVPNVSARILSKVLDYCKKHVEAAAAAAAAAAASTDGVTVDKAISAPEMEAELKAWDADFVKVDPATLLDIIMAANYLNIKELLKFTCQTVADMIKGKTSEEIRKALNIKNDFAPVEEEAAGRESLWAFE